MRQQFQDAMAVVWTIGKPDLFITFTCNPTWPEITNALEPSQKPNDRPDIICRIFYEKVNCLMNDIRNQKIFGIVLGSVHVVEFQKRGLLHARILLILDQTDKPTCPRDIDATVSAELPDQNLNPTLYETITRNMIHGPCGPHNPNTPCMVKWPLPLYQTMFSALQYINCHGR